jgi:DNA repair protein RecO (recombination protein O)
MLYKAEAVVIRSMDYGEGNKIITLYTKQWGKVSVMARGAKKMKSRHSAITQLFTYGEYTYYKTGSMGNLNYGEIINSHHLLHENIHKTAYAAYILEMIDRMLIEQEGSSYLFEQLIAALDAIADDKDPQVITHLFEMKMLRFAGYTPILDQCVSCEASCDQPLLSIEMGGLLCDKCRQNDKPTVQFSARTLKLLRLFQQMDLKRLGKIEVSDESKSELKQCMRKFMDTHVSGFWKSRNFLDQMEKYDM